jgi:phosphomannomutase
MVISYGKSLRILKPEALTMALALADKTNADIVVGTDPDCDRLGLLLR